MELKDVVEPKWALETKRGWGMCLTFLGTAMPIVSLYVQQWTGLHIDAPMVALVGEAVTHVIDDVGVLAGVVLWVWGSFAPTAPITVLPPK